MATKAAAKLEIIDITKVGDKTIYNVKAGRLNIRCAFNDDISDEAARDFSRVFHAVMERVAIDATAERKALDKEIERDAAREIMRTSTEINERATIDKDAVECEAVKRDDILNEFCAY